MKQTFYILTLFFASFNLFGQTKYSGFIDKYSIELVIDNSSGGNVRAIYAYSDYDEPIEINGKIEQRKLTLYEKNSDRKNKAILTFEDFDAKNNQLKGIWTDLASNKQLKISLVKDFEIDYGENIEWTNREIIQSGSLRDRYFKVIISKAKDEFYAKVTGVKILEKKTDKLIQQIDSLQCQLLGLNSISVDDYNFDGIDDFSVFEQSYAGPNTSSLYFLCNAKTNTYFESGFSGVSLAFDSRKKRIYERNQCCAGTAVTTAEYKVINNKMILVKEKCFKWDEKRQKLTERKMRECQ
ncbi:MAG: hypothetical protein J0I84_07295 [Terrimonas sp.]|nr:hypothetical protein [Terrimonas sp.]OJY95531.1 MAG: hypothetical protein BGP13_11830 [Sphingobacteriales bacterium 40-81]